MVAFEMLPFDRPRARVLLRFQLTARVCCQKTTDKPKMDSPQYWPELNDLNTASPILGSLPLNARSSRNGGIL